MGSINQSAYASLISSFGKFAGDASVKESTIAKIDQFTLTGVKSLKAGTGDFKGNLLRDAAQIASNNSVRNEFKKAVIAVFGGEDKVPPSVKTAMKWNDFDGKGRPLTARRINAALVQIRMQVELKEKCDPIRAALQAQDWTAGLKTLLPEAKSVFAQYIKCVSDEMSHAMERLLLPDIRKGKAPSEAKMRAFMEMFSEDSKAAKEILDRVKSKGGNGAVEVGNAAHIVLIGALSTALAKNYELADFFFGSSRAADESMVNFSNAGDELLEEAKFFEDYQKTLDVSNRISSMQNAVTSSRGYYVLGLSETEAVSELMRLTVGESVGESMRQGKVVLHDVVQALKLTPGPKAKNILAKFLAQIGRQILDGSIRKKIEKGTDALYGVISDDLKSALAACAKNRELNKANGNDEAQPESVTGSVQDDERLLRQIGILLAK